MTRRIPDTTAYLLTALPRLQIKLRSNQDNNNNNN